MGIYVYTLRKRCITIELNGEKFKANLMSYAYKEWFNSSFEPEIENRRSFIRRNAMRAADNAWESDRSGYVVMDDPEYGYEDAMVVADLIRPLWYDTDTLPAETTVGWLHREGRKWVVKPYTNWVPRRRLLADSGVPGVWVNIEIRSILNDEGKVKYEERPDENVKTETVG